MPGGGGGGPGAACLSPWRPPAGHPGSCRLSQYDRSSEKPQPAGGWKVGQESPANYLDFGNDIWDM